MAIRPALGLWASGGRPAPWSPSSPSSGNVIAPLQNLSTIMQQATGGLQGVEELSTEEPQVVDAPDESLLPRLSQEIRLDDVSFSYIGEQVNVKRVSLAVDAGQNVASVDPSGCGMSTILNRVMRFYDPTEGSVNIDGRKELRMAEDAQKTNNPKLELRLKFPDAQERENFEAAFQDWYKEIKRRTVAQRLRAERGEAVDDGQLAAIEDDVEGDFYEGWPCKLRFEESGPLGTTLETWY